jgi:hypothetical protein
VHRGTAADRNEIPACEASATAEHQNVVCLEVCRCRRHAGTGDILLRGDEHVRIGRELSCHQAIVGNLSAADEKIDIVATLLEATLRLDQQHANFGMSASHLGDRAEQERSDIRRSADTHRSPDTSLVRSHEIASVGQRIEPARALIVKGATKVGHSQRARCPLDEPNTELALELGESTADRRGRDAESVSRLLETAQIHHRHEGLGREQVHRLESCTGARLNSIFRELCDWVKGICSRVWKHDISTKPRIRSLPSQETR